MGREEGEKEILPPLIYFCISYSFTKGRLIKQKHKRFQSIKQNSKMAHINWHTKRNQEAPRCLLIHNIGWCTDYALRFPVLDFDEGDCSGSGINMRNIQVRLQSQKWTFIKRVKNITLLLMTTIISQLRKSGIRICWQQANMPWQWISIQKYHPHQHGQDGRWIICCSLATSRQGQANIGP